MYHYYYAKDKGNSCCCFVCCLLPAFTPCQSLSLGWWYLFPFAPLLSLVQAKSSLCSGAICYRIDIGTKSVMGDIEEVKAEVEVS